MSDLSHLKGDRRVGKGGEGESRPGGDHGESEEEDAGGTRASTQALRRFARGQDTGLDSRRASVFLLF